jgi:hypothetical protein
MSRMDEGFSEYALFFAFYGISGIVLINPFKERIYGY